MNVETDQCTINDATEGKDASHRVNSRNDYKVVIVDYGKAAAVTALIRQLAVQTLPPREVAVIDNSPEPRDANSAAACLDLPFSVDYQHNPENIGYSRACNIGAEGDSSFILFVNPDIEFESTETMRSLIEQMLQSGTRGPAGVCQRNPDHSFEVVARRVPTISAIIGKRVPLLGKLFSASTLRYTSSYANEHNMEDQAIAPVEWLQSSFLLLPRSTWQQVGKFDERYFVFMADVDYGIRCWDAGMPSHLFRNHFVSADGLRSSRGGLPDILTSRSLQIHLMDAAKFFIRQTFRNR